MYYRHCHQQHFWWGTKFCLKQMVINILILPALPHTITYLATDSCALPWCTRCTLLQCIASNCSDQTLPGELRVAREQGMFLMYGHLQHQTRMKNTHSNLHIS